MTSWLDGPPESQAAVDALRAIGVPEHQLASIRVGSGAEVWACNVPALAVFMALPWRYGPGGPVGLDWAELPRVQREHRRLFRRPDRRELPALLRDCEGYALDVIAEKNRKTAQ